jgi:acetolactate synthase-1/2/3 large subunit
MSETTGGMLMARTLATLGVEHVFALHGGHLDAFLVAAPDEGLQIIDTRHEAAAGHAADGYARVTGGKVGVAVITAGPGFTNALTPMVSAYLDAIPTLFFAGSPPLREVETNPLQGGFDQVAMAAPVSKWAHRITHTERIPDIIEKAMRIARHGRPGPVFLDIPIDVMFAPVSRQMLPVRTAAGVNGHRPPAPQPAVVEDAMALLRTASRPVIVAGGGTIFSAAADPIRRFAEASGIPVVTNSKAHGLLPAEHGLYCGGTGVVGAATMTGNPPDVVIMAGARQGMYTGGRSGSVVPPGAKLIQIDLDATEIGRLRVADLAVIADCSETFSALTAAGEADGSNWPDYSAWVQTLVNLRAAGRAMFEDQPVEPRPGLLHPYHAAKAAMQALTADTTVVFDGGESGAWCDLHLRSAGPGRFMSNGYLGCLGCGPGMAIGAALARPDSRVAVFSGDGAAGFNIQEFDTMVRHALPILTVVLNNACWGMSQHGQDIVYGANRRSAVALAASRYDEVAAAFGAWGANVNRLEDIAPAIEEAQAQAGPACINITTDPDIVHPVTPAMVGDVSAEDEIAIPYYENIPID